MGVSYEEKNDHFWESVGMTVAIVCFTVLQGVKIYQFNRSGVIFIR